MQKVVTATATLPLHHFKEKIKFRLDSWIYIRAKINGEDTSREFILDSGSPCSLIYGSDQNPNIKFKKVIASKGQKIGYAIIPTMIGNIKYNDAGYDLINYSTPFNLTGLIGVNIMQSCIWSINFKDSSITITDRLDTLEQVIKGYKIPFKPFGTQKTPVIKIVVNGNDTSEAFIDLGDFGVVNTNSSFPIEKIKEKNPENIACQLYNQNRFSSKQQKDSISKSYDIRLKSFKLGNLDVNNVLDYHDPDYRGKNLVGINFLKNFIITIDWINDTIYLKPIEEKVIPSNITTFGFSCFLDGTTLKVSTVYENSAAEKQGLKSGDEIETINNIAAKDITGK